MITSTYYLTDSSLSTERFVAFDAVFSESCKIDGCYIIASSVKDAIRVLYEQLSDIYGEEYLNNHLLSIKFNRRFPVYE